MAYKRKRVSRPFRRRLRRSRRRIVRARRPIRSNNTHMFKRVVELAPKVSANPTGSYNNTSWAFVGALNDLPNVSEFVSLYDQYRINKIKYTVIPNWSGLDGGSIPVGNAGGGANFYWPLGQPNIHSVIDHDDANVLTNVTDLMQYSTYRRTVGSRQHSRYFTPCVNTQLYASATTGGSTPAGIKYKEWIDLTARDVPHFGLKFLMDPGPIADNGTQFGSTNAFCRVYVTYYFECRGVR